MSNQKLTDEEKTILQKMRDVHGDAHPFRVSGDLVIVRRATVGDTHRYKEKLGRAMAPQARHGRGGQPSIADAERELALSSIVWPEDRARVSSLLDLQPGFIGIAASMADDLASAQVEDLEGN